MIDITFFSILSLAITDAINPCAFAVMILVLSEFLTRNPKNKRNILLGGLAFSLAVFVLYFIYGLVMTKFFSKIPETGFFTLYVSKGFGVLSLFLGLMNIKDFLNYRPGGFATEMPMKFRPRMRLLVKKVESPLGAFVVGIFVTLFLLPCSIGPYIIASEQLATLNFIKTVLWLLLYNLIFIIPMLAITFIIYASIATVDKVSGWRERNIKKLHLIEGIILIIIGILMVTGIIY